MTQTQQILAHLRKHKTITPMEALKRYGVMRLGGRAYELRCMGYDIETKLVTVRTRSGKARVARYKLI